MGGPCRTAARRPLRSDKPDGDIQRPVNRPPCGRREPAFPRPPQSSPALWRGPTPYSPRGQPPSRRSDSGSIRSLVRSTSSGPRGGEHLQGGGNLSCPAGTGARPRPRAARPMPRSCALPSPSAGRPGGRTRVDACTHAVCSRRGHDRSSSSAGTPDLHRRDPSLRQPALAHRPPMPGSVLSFLACRFAPAQRRVSAGSPTFSRSRPRHSPATYRHPGANPRPPRTATSSRSEPRQPSPQLLPPRLRRDLAAPHLPVTVSR